ncbi:MAG: crotonase/enoyl-CoA hydratase family protein [Parasphingopyxis sp.]
MDQTRINPEGGQIVADGEMDLGLEGVQLDRGPATELFDLGQLEVQWDASLSTLWTYMTPAGRPNFDVSMLRDFETWQREIARIYGREEAKLSYLVLGSRFPGVWNLGGDLGLFADYIRAGDRQGLIDYGEACTGILHRNINRLGLPIVTIGLVQGQALGGGFEALLSFNVIIAEESAKFGLPEIAFGLFPGMGAHSLLARRIGIAKAEQLILGNRSFTARQMQEAGLVHRVVPDGEGEAEVVRYIQENCRRHAGNSAVYAASNQVMPVSLDELNRIVEIWADTALKLRDKDLKLMERLVRAQTRLSQGLNAG